MEQGCSPSEASGCLFPSALFLTKLALRACECDLMRVTYQVLLLIKEEQKQDKTTALLLSFT